jgi:hypothetical protein
MPANHERAVAFALAHGSGVERYMLDNLADENEYEATSVTELEQQLLEGQRPDGGWAPFWASNYSSLDATCYRLAQAEMARLSLPRAAFDFLRSRQQPDGRWEEDESVRDQAPPWAKPGDLAAQLYLTANCGWWLINGMARGESGYQDETARAGAYLERYQAEDGSLPSFLQTHWLAAALWIRLEWGQPDVPEQAKRTLDYLATQLNDETPAGALGWMLTTLAGLDVPEEHPVIVKAVALLSAQQRPDGGWTSEDGPERDAWVTMQALVALIQWGSDIADGLSNSRYQM